MPADKNPRNFEVALKKASALKKEGKVEEAILVFREAFKKIGWSAYYGIDMYLRLPLYLNLIGKKAEAWQEYNILLRNYRENEAVLPMSHSKIYDKMRLFLEKEGLESLATKYALLSRLSWEKGLIRQNRKDEYKGSVSATREFIIDSLKKIGKENKRDALMNIYQNVINNIANIDLESIPIQIDQVLELTPYSADK